MSNDREREDFEDQTYAELQDCDGIWYAEQTAFEGKRVRRSVGGFQTRESLVAAMAFGAHKWTHWSDGLPHEKS